MAMAHVQKILNYHGTWSKPMVLLYKKKQKNMVTLFHSVVPHISVK